MSDVTEKIQQLENEVKVLTSLYKDEKKKREELEAIVNKLETVVDVHEVILEKLEKTVKPSESKSDDDE